MKKLNFNFHRYEFDFPAKEKPLWADRVERWPQLDAYAYGLPQAYVHWREHLQSQAPDLVILASPESSNRTDYSFAQTGANSPSKFVHTLPNSRSAALLQVMDWAGPLLCFQSDPKTQQIGLSEGADFAQSTNSSCIWVFSVICLTPKKFEANLFEITPSFGTYVLEPFAGDLVAHSDSAPADLVLRDWLKNVDASGPFLLLNRYLIKNNGIELETDLETEFV